MLLSGFDLAIPNGAPHGWAVNRVTGEHSSAPLQKSLISFSGVDHVVPPFSVFSGQQIWISFCDKRSQPQCFRVVGYDQEVKWTNQPGTLPGGGQNLFPLGKAVGFIGTQAVTDHP